MQWLVQVAQQRSATTPVHFHKQYGFCLSIDIGTEPPWLLYLSSTYSVLPADEFSLFELAVRSPPFHCGTAFGPLRAAIEGT